MRRTSCESDLIAREQAVDQREKAANLRDKAVRAEADARAQVQRQLRDANEHLVIATLHAQRGTTAAEDATARMSYAAQHDFLTGLANRGLLTDHLAQAIALANRHARKVAVIYVDLDDFKGVNDSLGHGAGDQLLQSVAGRLQACVRESDTVSRFGGDEFVVLLSEIVDAADAALMAQKLMVAMRESHVIEGRKIAVTLSIGIGVYPDDGTSLEALIRNADMAMYAAKRSGRNGYRRFSGNTEAGATDGLDKNQA